MADTLKDILSTFLGALLGIPAGLALNYAWTKRVDLTRRKQLIAAIRRSVEFNSSLLTQIKSWIVQPGGTPFFNVDLGLLDSTSSLKYELLDDMDLCNEIESLRYELLHISRKVDLLLAIDFDPSARIAISTSAGSMYQLLRTQLTSSLGAHIGSVEAALSTLKSKLGEKCA